MNLMAGPPEMMAVHENREANALIDIYTHEFKSAFGINPIFESGGFHIQIFKEIAKSTQSQAAALITHYFKMKDEWFQKQGYSPECLKKHLTAVAIDLQRRGPLQPKAGFRVTIDAACDKCFKYFKLTCTPQFINSEKPFYCEECAPAKEKQV